MPRFQSVSNKRDEHTVYTGSTDGKSKHEKVHNYQKWEKCKQSAMSYQHTLIKLIKIQWQNTVLSVVVERAWTLEPKRSFIQQLFTKCQIQVQISVPLIMSIDGLILALPGLHCGTQALCCCTPAFSSWSKRATL